MAHFGPIPLPISVRISVQHESPLILRALSAVSEERSAAEAKAERERAETLNLRIREFRELLSRLGIFYDLARASELIDRIESFIDDPLTIKTESIYFSYYWNSEETRAELQIGLDGSETRHIQWSTIPVLSILDLGYAIEQILSGEYSRTRFVHTSDQRGKE